jgi:dienelactone hydrolase
MTISKEIEDVESVIEFLKSKEYEEIIVLGASFGASIVSLVDYSKFNEVKALILWYGALDNYEVLRTDNFLSERNKEIALRDGFYKSYNKAGKLFRFGIPLFEEINIYKPKDKIQTINLPKLFVHGLADETVSYKVSQEVHNKCENSKLELIENGSHTFDTDNQALKDSVDKTVDFIKEIF